MMNTITKREEQWAVELDNLVVDMLAIYNSVDIDRVEAVFERNCSKCRLSKDCKQCVAHNKFVAILDRV